MLQGVLTVMHTDLLVYAKSACLFLQFCYTFGWICVMYMSDCPCPYWESTADFRLFVKWHCVLTGLYSALYSILWQILHSAVCYTINGSCACCAILQVLEGPLHTTARLPCCACQTFMVLTRADHQKCFAVYENTSCDLSAQCSAGDAILCVLSTCLQLVHILCSSLAAMHALLSNVLSQPAACCRLIS